MTAGVEHSKLKFIKLKFQCLYICQS